MSQKKIALELSELYGHVGKVKLKFCFQSSCTSKQKQPEIKSFPKR